MRGRSKPYGYEYKVQHFHFYHGAMYEIEEQLNGMDDQGWEILTVSYESTVNARLDSSLLSLVENETGEYSHE